MGIPLNLQTHTIRSPNDIITIYQRGRPEGNSHSPLEQDSHSLLYTGMFKKEVLQAALSLKIAYASCIGYDAFPLVVDLSSKFQYSTHLLLNNADIAAKTSVIVLRRLIEANVVLQSNNVGDTSKAIEILLTTSSIAKNLDAAFDEIDRGLDDLSADCNSVLDSLKKEEQNYGVKSQELSEYIDEASARQEAFRSTTENLSELIKAKQKAEVKLSLRAYQDTFTWTFNIFADITQSFSTLFQESMESQISKEASKLMAEFNQADEVYCRFTQLLSTLSENKAELERSIAALYITMHRIGKIKAIIRLLMGHCNDVVDHLSTLTDIKDTILIAHPSLRTQFQSDITGLFWKWIDFGNSQVEAHTLFKATLSRICCFLFFPPTASEADGLVKSAGSLMQSQALSPASEVDSKAEGLWATLEYISGLSRIGSPSSSDADNSIKEERSLSHYDSCKQMVAVNLPKLESAQKTLCIKVVALYREIKGKEHRVRELRRKKKELEDHITSLEPQQSLARGKSSRALAIYEKSCQSLWGASTADLAGLTELRVEEMNLETRRNNLQCQATRIQFDLFNLEWEQLTTDRKLLTVASIELAGLNMDVSMLLIARVALQSYDQRRALAQLESTGLDPHTLHQIDLKRLERTIISYSPKRYCQVEIEKSSESESSSDSELSSDGE